jgi:hypothetical protein
MFVLLLFVAPLLVLSTNVEIEGNPAKRPNPCPVSPGQNEVIVRYDALSKLFVSFPS